MAGLEQKISPTPFQPESADYVTGERSPCGAVPVRTKRRGYGRTRTVIAFWLVKASGCSACRKSLRDVMVSVVATVVDRV